MAIDVADLDRAADAFADIPFGGNGWTHALDALSGAVGALGTVVLPLSDAVPGPIPHSPVLAEGIELFLRSEWFERDLRRAGIARMKATGGVLDQQIFTSDTLSKHPYYREFLPSIGIGWFAGVKVDIAGRDYCLAIQKAAGAEPFTPDELSAIVRLAPRISMSLAIMNALDRQHLGGAGDTLETMPLPAFLLERTGRVLKANGAAASIIGNGLDITDGLLRATGPDAVALAAYVGLVLHDRDGLASSLSGVPIRVRREHGRPLLIRIQRLRTDAALSYFASAWAIVTVVDPDRRAPPSDLSLLRLFGLTRKEADICRLLGETDGNTALTAERAHILYQTLRSHLKHIHGKTGTRSMGELVALLGRLSDQTATQGVRDGELFRG